MHTKFVYLLHFSKPLVRHLNGKKVAVRHYLGSTTDVRKRLNQHWTGRGTPLTNAFFAKGIPFVLAMLWDGDRKVERKLKDHKKAADFCPFCIESKKHEVR